MAPAAAVPVIVAVIPNLVCWQDQQAAVGNAGTYYHLTTTTPFPLPLSGLQVKIKLLLLKYKIQLS